MTAKYDLEDRLLEYSAGVARLVDHLASTRAGNHVAGQLIRSGTSPLFNHGEAQAAESNNDFIHKFKICLKELKETRRALKLVLRVPLVVNPELALTLLSETEELIRIFAASIRTAEGNTREDPPVWSTPKLNVES